MRLIEFERRAVAGLSAGLPGVAAQLLLSPRPRLGWRPDELPPDCRAAAALAAVFEHDGRSTLVLTVRTGELPQHAGQVSLPGGAVETGESIVDAALREAEEEVGVSAAAVRVLGKLSPLHIPVSKFVLHPVLGILDVAPRLTAEPGEVQRILTPPIDLLHTSAAVGLEHRESDGRRFEVPFVRVDGEKVWGATAMVLAEILSLIGCPPMGGGAG